MVPDFFPQKDDLFVLLGTSNKIADAENERRLEQIEKPVFEYEAIVTDKFDEKMFPTKRALVLKVGAQVMMLKNEAGKWHNGSLATVTSLKDDQIKVRCAGEEVKMERNTWESVEYEYNKEEKKIEPIIKGTFSQYPIRLAWAITIHKSQGKTYDQVVIDMGNGAFAHGQTYVALSRCRTLEGIILKKDLQFTDLIVDRKVKNFMNQYS